VLPVPAVVLPAGQAVQVVAVPIVGCTSAYDPTAHTVHTGGVLVEAEKPAGQVENAV